jgi:hypothetical protein
VHLETRDGFLAALGRAKLQRGPIRGVILPRTGLDEDDVLDLIDTSAHFRLESCYTLLVATPPLTWFMSTSIPALRPAATASSSTASNRFFSRITALRKSVLST